MRVEVAIGAEPRIFRKTLEVPARVYQVIWNSAPMSDLTAADKAWMFDGQEMTDDAILLKIASNKYSVSWDPQLLTLAERGHYELCRCIVDQWPSRINILALLKAKKPELMPAIRDHWHQVTHNIYPELYVVLVDYQIDVRTLPLVGGNIVMLRKMALIADNAPMFQDLQHMAFPDARLLDVSFLVTALHYRSKNCFEALMTWHYYRTAMREMAPDHLFSPWIEPYISMAAFYDVHGDSDVRTIHALRTAACRDQLEAHTAILVHVADELLVMSKIGAVGQIASIIDDMRRYFDLVAALPFEIICLIVACEYGLSKPHLHVKVEALRAALN